MGEPKLNNYEKYEFDFKSNSTSNLKSDQLFTMQNPFNKNKLCKELLNECIINMIDIGENHVINCKPKTYNDESTYSEGYFIVKYPYNVKVSIRVYDDKVDVYASYMFGNGAEIAGRLIHRISGVRRYNMQKHKSESADYNGFKYVVMDQLYSYIDDLINNNDEKNYY